MMPDERKYNFPKEFADTVFNKNNEDLKSTLESLKNFISSSTPLDLELGCGTGFHPVSYAKKNLNRNLIAIEKTKEKFKSFENRFKGNNSPKNLLPVHGDGELWTVTQIPDNSISKIFLLYPNPYHKKAQNNLRWHNRPFIHELLKKLKTSGQIELRTNIKDYFDEALQKLNNIGSLKLIKESDIQPSTDSIQDAATHFEKKYLERNETCFLGIWEKLK
jgi:tRNA (guanine-N(7)-)-methyltransferase